MTLSDLVPRILSPEHFTTPSLRLAFASGRETVPWEVFQGRLLPAWQSREARTFESWSVHLITTEGPSPEPVVSVKAAEGKVFVVRGVECDVWAGQGEGVIEPVRQRRWARELIATLDADERLEEELPLALERAFTGTPLPLTALESPHPLFSFGLLAYQPPGPFDSRKLELLVRSAREEDLDAVSAVLNESLTPEEWLRLMRQVFLGVSLSPWTSFVPRLFGLFARSPLPPGAQAEFHAWLLTLVCRHLTAYDLVTFHYRGANYPDALLLDESLGRLLALLPEAGLTRTVRRALRQAWLLRRLYEGLAVPDEPTSPGEQERALPGGRGRVPEEQLEDVRARVRRLFTEPVAIPEDALRAAVEDLGDPAELEELGAAVFLDRPLGVGKTGVEPDATPALATLAFSATIATARLRALQAAGLLDAAAVDDLRTRLTLPGVSLSEVGLPARAATVSLADASRVAPDFVFRRTLPGSQRRLRQLFDWTGFPQEGWGVIALTSRRTLMIHGPMLELEVDLSEGYFTRLGVELPAAGLRAGGSRVLPYQR
jgi:hypothetical protein